MSSFLEPPSTEPAPGSRVPVRQRLWGIDLARFIAVVGMMAAHLVASRQTWGWLDSVTAGFPSTLFAVLGGFGLVFAGRRYLRKGNVCGAVIAGVVRGALILSLGFLLELLPPHPIAVILIYYGTALTILAPAVLLPSWALTGIALALAVGGPFLISLIPHSGSLNLGSPHTAVVEIFFGGTYPVITWVVYLLAGMVLCRWILGRQASGDSIRPPLMFLLAGGAAALSAHLAGFWYLRNFLAPQVARLAGLPPEVAADSLTESAYGSPLWAGWPALMQVSPHSGSLMDIIRTGGFSVAIIGACLLLARTWHRVPPLLRPAVGVGAAPLTSYTAHLVMTSFGLAAAGGFQVLFDGTAPWWVSYDFAIQLAVLLIFGAVLAGLNRRGPLEAAISRVAQTAAQSVGRPQSDSL